MTGDFDRGFKRYWRSLSFLVQYLELAFLLLFEWQMSSSDGRL